MVFEILKFEFFKSFKILEAKIKIWENLNLRASNEKFQLEPVMNTKNFDFGP